MIPLLGSATKKRVAAIGLEARHADAGRHLELLQDLARSRIDPPQLALVAFPGAVPQLAVDPGDAGDEAVGFDGAQDLAGLGIDLMDLALAMLADPERPFGPGHAGVAAVAGRRDRREHAAGLGIDLLDAVLGDLEQVPAVESRAGMGGDVDRAHRLAALGIERVQPVAGGEPDVLAVEGDAGHVRRRPERVRIRGRSRRVIWFHAVAPLADVRYGWSAQRSSRPAGAPGVTRSS